MRPAAGRHIASIDRLWHNHPFQSEPSNGLDNKLGGLLAARRKVSEPRQGLDHLRSSELG